MSEEKALVKQPRPLAESKIAVFDVAAFDQMYRVAKAMAAASLIPDHLKFRNDDGLIDEKRTAANCFLIVNQAARWEMCPFSLMAGSYIVADKLSWEGKVIAGVVNARAGLKDRLDYSYRGEDDSREITVSGIFKGETKKRELTATAAEFKKFVTAKALAGNQSLWNKGGVALDQKLAYSGALWWARRFAPELVLGVVLEDESLSEGNGEAVTVTLVDTSPSVPPPSPSAPPRGQTALEAELGAPEAPPSQGEPEGKSPATTAALRHALKTNPVTLREAAAAMDPPIAFDDETVLHAGMIPANRIPEALDAIQRLANVRSKGSK